jgi:hypothetical protein
LRIANLILYVRLEVHSRRDSLVFQGCAEYLVTSYSDASFDQLHKSIDKLFVLRRMIEKYIGQERTSFGGTKFMNPIENTQTKFSQATCNLQKKSRQQKLTAES